MYYLIDTLIVSIIINLVLIYKILKLCKLRDDIYNKFCEELNKVKSENKYLDKEFKRLGFGDINEKINHTTKNKKITKRSR